MGLAIEARQIDEHPAHDRIQGEAFHQRPDFRHGLALQGGEQGALLVGIQPGLPRQALKNAHVTQVQEDVLHPGHVQGGHHQAENLQVALHPGMTVQFGADLQGAAGSGKAVAPGTEHAADIAQAVGLVPAQLVGVDTRRLGRDVRAYAQQAAADLVGHLEGLVLQVLAGPGEQGVEVLDERGDHQLISPAAELVQQAAAQGFQARGLLGQELVYALGQQPVFV